MGKKIKVQRCGKGSPTFHACNHRVTRAYIYMVRDVTV